MNFDFEDVDEYGKNPFNNGNRLTAADLLDFLEDLESDDVDLSQVVLVFQEGHRMTEIGDIVDDTDENGIIVLKK